jgi:hypothetical protein
MSEGDEDALWPVGTLGERMDNKAEFDEHGRIDIGPEDEMLARWRAWRAEHEAVLRALGIPIAGQEEQQQQPAAEEESGDDLADLEDISDLNDYDYLLRKP